MCGFISYITPAIEFSKVLFSNMMVNNLIHYLMHVKL